MFNQEVEVNHKIQKLLLFSIFLSLVLTGLLVIKEKRIREWVLRKESVTCIPVESDFSHPIVYNQTMSHPVRYDARIKTFVEQYIHLTEDEIPTNYWAISKDRDIKSKFLEDRFVAAQMSSGIEQQKNLRRYAQSGDRYEELKTLNSGWAFFIDSILLYGFKEQEYYLAVVRGEYHFVSDTIVNNIPSEFKGYREIRLAITQGAPSRAENGALINKEGLYVTLSSNQVVPPDLAFKLEKESYRFYLEDSLEHELPADLLDFYRESKKQ